MAEAAGAPVQRRGSAFAPLRERTFRRIWSASVLSNLGQLILGVGCAWEMTRIANSPTMIALVQTALMLPLMLVAIPAGAMADMFDRRKVAMGGLAFAAVSSATLTLLSGAGLITPALLLGFCFLIGAGVALYGPAWQSSIAEQVKPEVLPAAIALGSVSYNIARSFGPALGGAIVVIAGASGAFAANAILYVPLLIALFLWRRTVAPPRLPPERIGRAIVSGVRYAIHAVPVRIGMIRALSLGLATSSTAALTPLVARDQLHGDAGTYGLLLGAGGVGAVAGALLVSRIRERLSAENAVRICTAIGGSMLIVVGLSHHLLLTCAALLIAGAASMTVISLLNIVVQLAVPRWVAARALAWFQCSLTGGIAVGSVIWGQVAGHSGVGPALVASGVFLAMTPLIGLLFKLPETMPVDLDVVEPRNELTVGLPLTARSGPIVIEIDYRVTLEDAREFYGAMLRLQRSRQRNGAFGWTVSRDIADPELWTERFEFPTWGDYIRHRDRFTQADLALQAVAAAFSSFEEGTRVRRLIERPFGSVRWRTETPDPHADPAGIY